MFRPLRPFFYKPVAILGVPLFYWKLSLAATILAAVILFFVWRNFYGVPVWFVFSLGFGLALVSFFLWAFNTHKRGWLEYTLSYYWRELTGVGQNLLPETAGRKKTEWLTDADNKNTAKAKWLARA